MMKMELNKQFDSREWFKINPKRSKPIPVLNRLTQQYGFTLKDLYDLVNLREYEARQRYLTRYEMPNEGYL